MARVFENEEDGQLKSISLEHDKIKATLSSVESQNWDKVLDPGTTPQDRDAQLTDLLGLPASGKISPHSEKIAPVGQ